MKRAPTREPIAFPRYWAWLAFLLLAGVPWYLPTGSVEPVVWGVPYWVWISVVLSLVFCASVRWGCLHLWHLEDDTSEEGDGAEDSGTE